MKAHLRKLLFALFGSFACLNIGASLLPVTAATSLPAVEEALSASPTLPDQPELDANLDQTDAEQHMAYAVYCQTYTNGYTTVTCCVDALGNWACVPH
jgi:hypothetical protein